LFQELPPEAREKAKSAPVIGIPMPAKLEKWLSDNQLKIHVDDVPIDSVGEIYWPELVHVFIFKLYVELSEPQEMDFLLQFEGGIWNGLGYSISDP
jgi:hypothetical protein